jgi:molybdopterin synthase sulfur carrier subunit
MATVFIPPQLRQLTGGVAQMELEGATVRQLVAGLESAFPGVAARLTSGSSIAPGLAVSVDGTISTLGLRTKVGPTSEVHFLPAFGGG